MIVRKSIQDTFITQCLLLLALLAVPLSVLGQSTTWQVKVGSQVPDCLVGAPSDSKLAEGCQAHQAIAFLPNEIWVHQNDSITWTQTTEENHTVTFVYEPQPTTLGVGPYPAAQQRPSNAVGCSAYGGVTSANNSAYDPSGSHGLQCVNSGVLPSYGSTYTISFPAQGNFKFTCLIHSSMNGIVHVLDPSATLPYSQSGYNKLGQAQVDNLTKDVIPDALSGFGSNPRVFTVGKLLGTGGGWQYGSLFRFVDANGQILTKDEPLLIHKGQTVEFTNVDPVDLTPLPSAAPPTTRPARSS